MMHISSIYSMHDAINICITIDTGTLIPFLRSKAFQAPTLKTPASCVCIQVSLTPSSHPLGDISQFPSFPPGVFKVHWLANSIKYTIQGQIAPPDHSGDKQRLRV
jgi:hypothetical protein